jgi:hypothetical protein
VLLVCCTRYVAVMVERTPQSGDPAAHVRLMELAQHRDPLCIPTSPACKALRIAVRRAADLVPCANLLRIHSCGVRPYNGTLNFENART